MPRQIGLGMKLGLYIREGEHNSKEKPSLVGGEKVDETSSGVIEKEVKCLAGSRLLRNTLGQKPSVMVQQWGQGDE